jgi:hypothetical protein
MRAKMRENKPRTSAGRKVDTWVFTLPDGDKASFDITLHSDPDGAWMSARTDHKILSSIALRHADINQLKDLVCTRVAETLDAHLAAEWTPSVLVELSLDDRIYMKASNMHGAAGAGLTFGYKPVDANTGRPVGNRGETQISIGDGPQTIVQRGHDEVFQKPQSMSDMRTIDAREYSSTVSRVVVPQTEQSTAALDAISACLQNFANAMAVRMAPGAVSRHGLPDPCELAEMMAAAATAPAPLPCVKTDDFVL